MQDREQELLNRSLSHRVITTTPLDKYPENSTVFVPMFNCFQEKLYYAQIVRGKSDKETLEILKKRYKEELGTFTRWLSFFTFRKLSSVVPVQVHFRQATPM